MIVVEDLQCLPKYLEEIRGKSQLKGAPGVDLTAVFDSWRTTRERGEKPKEIQRTCKGNEIMLCSHGHQHCTKLKRHWTNCNRIQVPRTLAFIFLQLPHLHYYIIRTNKYRFSTYHFQSAINATNRLFQFWLDSTVTTEAAFSSVGSSPYFHQSSLTTAFSTSVFNSITSTAAKFCPTWHSGWLPYRYETCFFTNKVKKCYGCTREFPDKYPRSHSESIRCFLNSKL